MWKNRNNSIDLLCIIVFEHNTFREQHFPDPFWHKTERFDGRIFLFGSLLGDLQIAKMGAIPKRVGIFSVVILLVLSNFRITETKYIEGHLKTKEVGACVEREFRVFAGSQISRHLSPMSCIHDTLWERHALTAVADPGERWGEATSV